MVQKKYYTGIDIGSTTAKMVILDKDFNPVFSEYRRHNAEIDKTFIDLINEVVAKFGEIESTITFTGSAGMGVCEKLSLPFTQEVIASAEVVKKLYPDIKTLIDIGGEDSKMIFFNEGKAPDIRMNGNCAGGTGSFIDQMSALMNIPIGDINQLAKNSKQIYPIASRCGVFAKTDIQSLLSQKVDYEDIAASIFHAVAIQTINALSRGVEVTPKVLFSGGPLAFLSSLRNSFIKLLNLKDGDLFIPDRPELFPAMGAAFISMDKELINFGEIVGNLKKGMGSYQIHNREKPLFDSVEQYENWKDLRQQKVETISIEEFKKDPKCFLGIDSGSTTTKMVLTNIDGKVVVKHYENNHGDHINAVSNGLTIFNKFFEDNSVTPIVLNSAVTGYGEDLIRTAFKLDEGVVETLAHFKAAKRFDPEVSFIMDIGGQDMKAMFIEDGAIQKIELNEACSSGCGSFIETFATTLGYTTANFADIACKAKAPCDLGTRCTVFMNSKVKQFLKEGVAVDDISAGLAYSVIKNSLYKVLKLRDTSILGDHIVVQGGSFQNPAIHKAFEKILDKKVLSPNIPGLMGAYGAALLAKEFYKEGVSDFIGFDNLSVAKDYSVSHFTCKGCENFCKIAKLKFKDGHFFTGNKCEKYFSNRGKISKKGESLPDYKLKLLFERDLKPKNKFLKIGIPRVLNIFENFPFWSTLFFESDIEVQLSPPSNSTLYEKGMGTVMSDNICFPAKLVHGHIYSLIESDVDRIFYPMVMHEKHETKNAINSFNCPIVMGYPEVVRSSINPEGKHEIPIDTPTITFKDEVLLKKSCYTYFNRLGVKKKIFEKAFQKALESQRDYKRSIENKGQELIKKAKENKQPLILLIGRPYHIDPLINHKLPEILLEQGCYIITEDSISSNVDDLSNLQVLTQWGYPNRVYQAALWALQNPEVEVVQLNSFGCGPDAIVVDEVKSILEQVKKYPTVVRIDEVSSVGSIRLRLRTMIESLKMRIEGDHKFIKRADTPSFSEEDKDERLILIPHLSYFYTPPTAKVFEDMGFKAKILPPTDQKAVDFGMKYTNNEICYPSILVVGDVLKAIDSGEYDVNKIAIGITQTGGQCRASTYLSLIKKGLIEAGYRDIPVIAIPTGSIVYNDQPGFKSFNPTKFMKKALLGIIFGDALSTMYYTTAVREKEKGKSLKLVHKYMELVSGPTSVEDFDSVVTYLEDAVRQFNDIEVYEDKIYPKIGIVGEIFIKYNDFGNHYLVQWLMEQGIEVVLPPLSDFFVQEISNIRYYMNAYIKKLDFTYYLSFLVEKWVDRFLKRVDKKMKNFRYNRPTHSVRKLAELASKVVSLINQYGEGWLIPAEVSAFVHEGINNVVCLQPFGCIANHVIAKGVEKKMRDLYPNLNILFLDLDADTSKVNYRNRLHFMVKTAKEEFEDKTLSTYINN